MPERIDIENFFPYPAKKEMEEADRELFFIVFVSGKIADEQSFYAYVKMPPSKYVPSRKAQLAGNYNLLEYGEILACGAGETPLPEVKNQMKELGVKEDFEAQVFSATFKHINSNSFDQDIKLLKKIEELKNKNNS